MCRVTGMCIGLRMDMCMTCMPTDLCKAACRGDIDTCRRMITDMCTDTCTDTRIDTYTGMCIDMCIDMRIEMCADMRIETCIDMVAQAGFPEVPQCVV